MVVYEGISKVDWVDLVDNYREWYLVQSISYNINVNA